VEQRAHFITVATADLDVVRSFYRDGLGWHPLLDVPGEIVFFQIGPGLVLGFFDIVKFDQDLDGQTSTSGISGMTLSHNVDSPAAVDEAVTAAVAAGGVVLKSPRQAAFGGYHGHVRDPNGVIWEIAYNPGWHVDESGAVTLG
jgi:catechol 2,3-dioxygenase-like lactoylglutathione lyase family enzyme